MKTLQVHDETHQELMLIKIQSKAKDLDSVIQHMLKDKHQSWIKKILWGTQK